jgi:hypothetical protein
MDLQDMQSLAERVSPATAYHHVGDLAWNWIFGRDQPRELWRDDEQVVGWAWLDGPDSAMIQVDPDRPDIADAAVAWAVTRGVARLELARTETTLVAAVRQAGFTPVERGPFMLVMRRPLAGPAALPDQPTARPGWPPTHQPSAARR